MKTTMPYAGKSEYPTIRSSRDNSLGADNQQETERAPQRLTRIAPNGMKIQSDLYSDIEINISECSSLTVSKPETYSKQSATAIVSKDM